MIFTRTGKKPDVKIMEIAIPEVMVSAKALSKMKLYTEGCVDEIGWLGTAFRDKEMIYIDDVMLFEQDVHGTTTEITPEGLSTFAEQLLQQEDGVKIWNSMKVWGHSHVNMTISPSYTDNKQMETFAGNGHDFFIRIITNKKGDIGIDLFDYSSGIQFLGLDWQEVISTEEQDLYNQINLLEEKIELLKEEYEKDLKVIVDKDISEKVRKKHTYAVSTYSRPYGEKINGQQYLADRENNVKKNNVVAIGKGNATNELSDAVDFLSTQDLIAIGEMVTPEDVAEYLELLGLEELINLKNESLLLGLLELGYSTIDAYYGEYFRRK